MPDSTVIFCAGSISEVAAGLVTVAAQQQAVTPAELAWETPLSRLGRKLAHHFQPAGYFAA